MAWIPEPRLPYNVSTKAVPIWPNVHAVGIMSPIPVQPVNQPIHLKNEVRKNTFSGTWDVFRPSSPEEPNGYYMACRSQVEATAISAFLSGDMVAATAALEVFRITRGLIKAPA